MAVNDWKRELQLMLDMVEEQATESFDLINRRFAVLGLPFDDEFRKNAVKMANLRLESCFAKIAMERWDARQSHAVDDNHNIETTNDSKASKASVEMDIFVEIPNGKTITLEVKPSDTIRIVKEKLQENAGIRVGRKHLLFRGEKLANNSSLSDCNVQKESTLILEPFGRQL